MATIYYRDLKPAKTYVFRVIALNNIGISAPSLSSEELHSPPSGTVFLIHIKLLFFIISFLHFVPLLILVVWSGHKHVYIKLKKALQKNK